MVDFKPVGALFGFRAPVPMWLNLIRPLNLSKLKSFLNTRMQTHRQLRRDLAKQMGVSEERIVIDSIAGQPSMLEGQTKPKFHPPLTSEEASAAIASITAAPRGGRASRAGRTPR